MMKKISYINEWNKQANLNQNLRYDACRPTHRLFSLWLIEIYGLTVIYFKPIYLNAQNTVIDI